MPPWKKQCEQATKLGAMRLDDESHNLAYDEIARRQSLHFEEHEEDEKEESGEREDNEDDEDNEDEVSSFDG
jgi:hypothetical protein